MMKMLLILISLSAVMADEFIALEPGIYKELIGDLKIEESKWNMVISFDIEEVDIKIAQTKKVFDDLNNFCIKIEKLDTHDCKHDMKLAKDLLNRLDKDKQRIFDLLGKSKTKRGLFNIVGIGFKYFFGTMNSDDAQKIGSKLTNLEKNEIINHHLLENQIHVVDDIFKIENDTIGHVVYNYELIKKQNEAINYVKNTLTRLLTSERKALFNRNLNFFHILFNLINNDLQNLERFLIDTHSNILNTQILSFTKIMSEIKKIRNYIPKNQEFTFNIDNPNMKAFINFYKLGYMYNKKKLYVVIQIPLMGTNNYKIFDLQPIPTCKENKCISYEISTDIYALDEINGKHIKTNTDFMEKNCKKMDETYYCTKINIIYKQIDKNCETSLFFQNKQNIKNYCKNKFFEIEDKLIVKLFHDNSYIIISSSEENSLLTCVGSKDDYIKIKKIMKIVINRNCKLSLKTMTLNFNHVKKVAETNLTLFEKFEFNFDTEITEMINNTQIEILPHVIDIEQYKNIGNKIENLKNDYYNKKQMEHSENDKKYTFFMIMTIFIIIVTIIIFMIYTYKRVFFNTHQQIVGYIGNMDLNENENIELNDIEKINEITERNALSGPKYKFGNNK